MWKSMQYVKDNQERKAKKLLEIARKISRRKHYGIQTEETYVGWIIRYIYFHNKQHPKDMGVPKIEAFLYSNEPASLG
jgi:5-bromo-4-chloroindolyl phosphate hydrolysis protein